MQVQATVAVKVDVLWMGTLQCSAKFSAMFQYSLKVCPKQPAYCNFKFSFPKQVTKFCLNFDKFKLSCSCIK